RALVRDGAAVALLAAPGGADDIKRGTDDLAASGGRVIGIASDLGDPQSAARAISETLTGFGRLDYLVDNAGVVNYLDFFSETVEDLDRMMRINVRGAYQLATEAARAMTEGGA